MRPITRILIVVLVVSGLMPLIAGIHCLFVQNKAIEFFGLTNLTTDMSKALVILGVSLLSIAVMHGLAIY